MASWAAPGNRLPTAGPGHPVAREIHRRLARLRAGAAPGSDDAKLGLVIEGGGMRGVISAGALVALERLGLTAAFDAVLGESAGALNACYFLAGEAALGARIYLEDLQSLRFLNPLRRGRILDVDFLVDEVMTRIKPLTAGRVLRSRSRLLVPLTNTLDGTGRIVDVKADGLPLLPLLKATAAIVPLYNGSVVLEGVPYADGGIACPLPVSAAIERGCTHVLVLLTRPVSYVARPYAGLERVLLERCLRRWDPRFGDAFLNIYRRYNESRALAFGRVASPRGVHIAVVAPGPVDPPVSRLTLRRARLSAAMRAGLASMLTLLGEPLPGAGAR
jgi:predicted patatin/cPLA2 family phospholipase